MDWKRFIRKHKSEEPPRKLRPWQKKAVLAVTAFSVVAACAFLLIYVRYAMMIQEKLGRGAVQTGTMLFASPKAISVGAALTPAELIAQLQRAGYSENGSRIGTFRRKANAIEITTGPESYFSPYIADIVFSGGRVSKIVSKTNNAASGTYSLEPELITNVTDASREKRRPVAYADLPPHLIKAIVAVEDKRFFQHGGLDMIRVAKAVYVDLKEKRKEQGASTLTMQLARSFWLDQDKTWKRKFAEVLLTVELERRFTKEQILEFYANEVYLGRRGSFSIHGVGEAARAYFGKDVRKLTIPESAMLVAVIQRPGYYNPFKYPDRVKSRRDLVLNLMQQNGYLDSAQYTAAIATPIRLSPAETESTDAPYFVDLVNDELQSRLGDKDFASNKFRVYTTLDLDLQRDAVAAVRTAMQEVDKNVRAKRGKKKDATLPQVALVALDPRTGDVKALVGGRSYASSQLDRALAKRQPGSSFKPFVYAAALNTAVERKREVITLATVVVDEPTTFTFNRQVYEPGNYHDQYYGPVTLRQALAKSLNIPTIKMAEKAGYQNVAEVARGAGMNANIQATPALALGAYEVTPLEIAEAYTIFTNKGAHLKRSAISSIRDKRNRIVFTNKREANQVLDPRVTYLMVNMMEDVVRQGTAAGVRSRGFTAPAAGKTGTSRDGWFAGFTSELLCVVWIGYDDNRELNLEGAKSALPVWTEFMKRAHQHPDYRDAKPFEVPAGIVRATIDPESGQLATPYCYEQQTEVFIAGTQPRTECQLHDAYHDGQDPNAPRERTGFFGRVLGIFR